MIIDSHVHYAYPKYRGEFWYLYERDGAYAVGCTDLESLLAQMKESGIVGFVEPAIGFDDLAGQLALIKAHHDCMWGTVGVHPTRCIHTAWKNRREVEKLAGINRIVAIGETGLDYHYPRQKQHRLRQKRWFVWQIKLAHRLELPLVLHIREADRDALRILRRYKKYLHGGIVHCFAGDSHLAEQYVELGFVLGIGGKLLGQSAQTNALRDTVANVPLSCLVVETDAPFVLPDLSELACSEKKKRKLCNSSFILPALLREIASIRGEDVQTVEQTVYQNTVRVYGLTKQRRET